MIIKTKKRINISVSDDIEEVISKLAKRDQIPVATKALDLIKRALLIEEDILLGELAQERDITSAKYIDHEELWKKYTK